MNTAWTFRARRSAASARMVSACLACATAVVPVLARPRPAAPMPHIPPPSVNAPPTPTLAHATVAFEANRGQADPRVRFVARGDGYALFLTGSETVLALEPGGASEAPSYLRMRFAGAAAEPTLTGEGRLAGTANFMRGSGPSSWRTGVERFGAVRVNQLYPGVDAVYYGADRSLEYDLVVAPGADASRVAVQYDGASRLSVDADGTLVAETTAGALRQPAPRVYQPDGASRRTVPCRFVVDGDTVRFAIGDHDASLPLVIDPELRFSTYFGGSNPDRGLATKLDVSGNIYVAGRTFSPDFPITGAEQSQTGGNYDAFVSKFDPTGTTLVYSTYIGGSLFDSAEALAVDAAGDAFVTGYTLSTDFPLANAYQDQNLGNNDVFVARLNAAGDTLVYSTYYGGAQFEEGHGIVLDSTDTAYVVGRTNSIDLPSLGGVRATYAGGAHDGFMTKFGPTGDLATSTYFGSGGDDAIYAVAIDAAGSIYITGTVGSPTSFPVVGAFQTTYRGGQDAFVTKLNPTLQTYLYSSFLGGSQEDEAFGIAVDSGGAAYVTGYTLSSNFPTVTPFQATRLGSYEAFATKVSPVGNALLYSTYLGGSGEDRANAVAVDQYGSAYVVGFTRSTNFPVNSALQRTNGGNGLSDAFVTKLSATGRIVVYSTYLGGSSSDVAQCVMVDAAGTAYVTGYTDSSNFPTANAFDSTANGVEDAFVARIEEVGDTLGVYNPATGAFFLRNSNSPGPADATFGYGAGGAGYVALAGDWNGDGIDTPGLYNPANGFFLLRNSNTPGAADIVFTFGAGGAGYVPIVGDWNGDGIDTIGLYNPATAVFFLKNTNSGGAADISFVYGVPGLVPIVGDWNGDGTDTVGVYNSATSTFFLRNSNSAGAADITFDFGAGGLTPLAGDWNADGIDTIGLFDAATGATFLRNTNTVGNADNVFFYGPGGIPPVVGDWNG